NPDPSRQRNGSGGVLVPPRSNARTHKSDQAAEAAIECWTQGLYELSQDRFFAQAVGVDTSDLSEIRDELIATERRRNLRDRVAEHIRASGLATDKPSTFAD